MNRSEFFEELEKRLRSLPLEEREEILRDQREHFDLGQRAGRTDEELIAAIGSPRTLAAEYVAQSAIESTRESAAPRDHGKNALQRALGVFGAILILAPLNFLVLIGPFVAISSVWVVGWAASLGVAGGGFFGIMVYLIAPERSELMVSSQWAVFFTLLALAGLGTTAVLLMVRVSEYYFKGLWSYAKWNLRFIQIRGQEKGMSL